MSVKPFGIRYSYSSVVHGIKSGKDLVRLAMSFNDRDDRIADLQADLDILTDIVGTLLEELAVTQQHTSVPDAMVRLAGLARRYLQLTDHPHHREQP